MNMDRKSLVEGLPERIKAGEQQAFLDFADEFHILFYHFFVLRGLPPYQAEDLAQNCMTDIPMKVVMGMFKQRLDASFRAWVLRLMRVSACDWWRDHYGHSTEVLPDDVANPDSDEIGPDLLRVLAVQDGMLQLAPDHREVIELHDLGESRTYREVGACLGISEAAARVRHHRAMKALEKILEADPRVHLKPAPSKEGIKTI